MVTVAILRFDASTQTLAAAAERAEMLGCTVLTKRTDDPPLHVLTVAIPSPEAGNAVALAVLDGEFAFARAQ